MVWHQGVVGVLLPTLVAIAAGPLAIATGPGLRHPTHADRKPGLAGAAAWYAWRAAAAVCWFGAALERAVTAAFRAVLADGVHLVLLMFQLPGFLWVLAKGLATFYL